MPETWSHDRHLCSREPRTPMCAGATLGNQAELIQPCKVASEQPIRPLWVPPLDGTDPGMWFVASCAVGGSWSATEVAKAQLLPRLPRLPLRSRLLARGRLLQHTADWSPAPPLRGTLSREEATAGLFGGRHRSCPLCPFRSPTSRVT